MKKRSKVFFILIAVSLIFIVFGCDDDSHSEGTLQPITCDGFVSPTLSINIIDSLTDEPIENAVTTLYTENSDGTYSDTVSWDHEANSYFVNAEDLTYGHYSVVASCYNYHTSVQKGMEFVADTSCGAENKWSITLY